MQGVFFSLEAWLHLSGVLLDSRYSELTRSVIGCAMEVHRTLEPGFQEIIYQRSLAVEMERAGLLFGREVEMPLFYKGVDVGSRRVDFLVGEAVLVELKALHELTPTHYSQIINYLEAYHLEVGLLLNFGERSLRFKRFIKSHLTQQQAAEQQRRSWLPSSQKANKERRIKNKERRTESEASSQQTPPANNTPVSNQSSPKSD